MSVVIGGPVAGLRVTDGTEALWVAGHTHVYDYAGGRYILSGGTAIIWQAFGEGQGTAFGSGRHQIDSAWRNLMRAYGVTMARALRRSAAGRKRMKRVVR